METKNPGLACAENAKSLTRTQWWKLPGRSRADIEGEEEEDDARKVENEVMNVIRTKEQRVMEVAEVTSIGKRHLWPEALPLQTK